MKKVLIGLVVGFLALLYVVSPLDVIPDIIPCAGYMDDAVALVGTLAYWAYIAYSIVKALSGRRGSKSANKPEGLEMPADKKDRQDKGTQ